MTHPSGEFATERLRDRMVITAKGLSRTSPSLFVEVMCFFIFSVSVMSGLPPGSGNPFDLPGFRIEDLSAIETCGEGITAPKMTRRCRGGSRVLCHSPNTVNSTSYFVMKKRRPYPE